MPGEEENQLIAQRREKLTQMRASGIDPFANEFHPSESAAHAKAHFQEGRQSAVAGRITAIRLMGKSIFCDVTDQTDRIQAYIQKEAIGEAVFETIKHLDLGDIVGVKGALFTTKTGEKSVKAASLVLLAKSLRPPPEKWHGLQDVETRYRQRYLDLMSNPEVRALFFQRSKILSEIRRFLEGRGYIEVETPMMQAVPGGAAAKPFITQHEALGCPFYLRIALELYLKRLLVGGFEKIFEIGRNFRNEGISRKHNPEFTMLEAYEAYGNFETMMQTVEDLIRHVASAVFGTLKVSQGKIDLEPAWERKRYKDLIRNVTSPDWFEWPRQKKFEKAIQLKLKPEKDWQDHEITNDVFEKIIEPGLIQPVFVTHLPKELVPLAKANKEDPSVVDVFELCINGQEIAPGYSEQNDPIEQRERLLHQSSGHEQKLDEDFLHALEHGMPPAGGIGIGIDRLVMMLTGAESIRDVIFFPQLKPKE